MVRAALDTAAGGSMATADVLAPLGSAKEGLAEAEAASRLQVAGPRRWRQCPRRRPVGLAGRCRSEGGPGPLPQACHPPLRPRQTRGVSVASRAAAGQSAITAADEQGLRLRGLLVFLDPPKSTARQALDRLAGLGVTVKVLTGDNAAVAAKVCADLGLPPARQQDVSWRR